MTPQPPCVLLRQFWGAPHSSSKYKGSQFLILHLSHAFCPLVLPATVPLLGFLGSPLR